MNTEKTRLPGMQIFEAIERSLRGGERLFAARPALLYFFAFTLPLVLNILWAVFVIPPMPIHEDEFAYLLQADTYLHGRLTNPTHPLHEFFEVAQVMQEPTYTAKYPPITSLFFALGQRLFGHPIEGEWIAVSLAGMAACYALRAVFPLRWTLFALLIFSLHGRTLYWSQTFLGGGIFLLGGALVTGGMLRLGIASPARVRWHARKRPSRLILAGALVGTGLGLLILSRPFEGVIVTVVCFVGLLVRWLTTTSLQETVRVLIRPAAAALLPLSCFLLFWLIYNRAVTGSPTTLPYMVYQNRFDPAAPLFAWQKAKTLPLYHNPLMRELSQFQLEDWQKRTNNGANLLPMLVSLPKLDTTLMFLTVLKVLFWVSLVGLVLAWKRSPRVRTVALCVVGFAVLTQAATYMQSHYTTPGVTLMLILLIAGYRGLALGTPKLYRRASSGLILAVLTLVMVGRFGIAAVKTHGPEGMPEHHLPIIQRQPMIDRLTATGEKHLVIVRYLPDQPYTQEWLYNLADIDSQPVVWAVDRGSETNRTLLDYYKDRKVHLLVLGDKSNPVMLQDYPQP